jgi:hypothetical protein
MEKGNGVGVRRRGAARHPLLLPSLSSHLGRLALHHQLHPRDVQTPRRDVGGDEDAKLFVAEAAQRRLARVLRHVAVQRARAERLAHRAGELVSVAFRFREHDGGAAVGVGADDVDHDRRALRPVARQHEVAHRGRRFQLGRAHEVDGGGVLFEEAGGDGFDPGREGGGKEQRLHVGVGRAARPQNLLHVVHEPHIEHLVALVQHAEAE